MTKVSDPFGHPGQAALYSAYRPTYPQAFLDDVLNAVSSTASEKSRYVDVCCGTGQLTFPLSKNFDSTVGVDRSEAQLAQARAACADKVTFVTGDALNLPVDQSHCVDLVTIGQALHWLPIDEFCAEAKRVLRKSGVLAVMGYSICSVESSPAAKQLFDEYFHKLDDFWDCDRALVDSAFAGVEFPFAQVTRTEYVERKSLALSAFHKYLQSMSSYRTWKDRVGQETGTDILDTFMHTLRAELGPNTETVELDTRFFLIKMRQ